MIDFSAAAFRERVQKAFSQDSEHARAPHDKTPIKDLAWHEGEVLHLKDAAVLIPIVDRGNEASIILTQRTDHLASHAGQIAFPGGKVDDHDASAEGAALREADEEIGLKPEFVDVFGYMRPYVSSTGFRIFPVLCTVREGFELVANPGEVADIFEVPLRFLMDPDNHQRKSAEWRGKMRHYFAMPYGDYYIWGVTAGILRNLYETVYSP
ncbi:CoA pyrophosphatase [Cohaesibacter celericrescens]|uniref:CoA pyrophosphatase n=1 Tax=Cohaesibacter celericrescens TaxID=2067669 RepID=UPI0035699065